MKVKVTKRRDVELDVNVDETHSVPSQQNKSEDLARMTCRHDCVNAAVLRTKCRDK